MQTSTSFKYFLRLSILSVLIVYCMNAQVTDTMHIERGWNLLSLPIKVVDGTKSVLFPTAVSDAFLFQDEYIHKDTLTNGMGFWLKFNSVETIILTGESIHRDTINVSAGWNMIGSLSVSVHESFITTEPEGIIISDYFYYDTEFGYKSSDTLKPGFGYWVKVEQDGIFILSSWVSCPGIPTVEYAGKTYNTVQIGSQCWLRENLGVGTMIQVSDTAKDNGTIEKYCYNDDPSNCDTYGGLYQWNEAMQYTTTSGARGICPPGWHLPTFSEFQTLGITIDGDGNALKAIGQGTGDGAGTNTSGFSALLSGYRDEIGYFGSLTLNTYFWSSREGSSTHASYLPLHYSINPFYLGTSSKGNGFSVRCLKD